jgi:phosphoribosylformylglycinamidine synthase
VGTAIAVSEAARNIVCAGGEPCAITNCLNFGNPYNPEVYWQFVHAIKGMGAACRMFQTPVTGGNVSFYNQSTDEGPVYPTPTIGMLGLLDKENRMTLNFKNAGDLIFLIGESKEDIASSEYLASFHNIKNSPAPFFDINKEYDVQSVVKELIKNKLIASAHDVSDGGLYITLLESSMSNNLGFEIDSDEDIRKDAFLFGEAQSRVVVSISPDKFDSFLDYLSNVNVEFTNLGIVTDGSLTIDSESFGSIAEAKDLYDNALERLF